MMQYEPWPHPCASPRDFRDGHVHPVGTRAAHRPGNYSRGLSHELKVMYRKRNQKTSLSSVEHLMEKEKSKTAVAKPKARNAAKPKTKPPAPLPPWKVLLHNDDKNEMLFVVLTIMELTPLNEQAATVRTVEAHKTGVSLILSTHKERAELYLEQFQSKGLTVTIEPA